MLKEFGPHIWIADGPKINAVAGFHYPTRMAVIKLSNGGLFIWSPISLTNELRNEVDTLGTVHHLIAPNSLHHLSLPDWARAYPNAKIYAAPGLRKKRRDISFDDELGHSAMPEWKGEIEQVVMEGNMITTEVVFHHVKSGTVLFTDLIQQFPQDWFTGWRSIIAKLDFMTEQEPAVPRKFRLAFTNRKVARICYERIAAWPARKVLMAHGTPVTEGGQAFIARAFRWLTL